MQLSCKINQVTWRIHVAEKFSCYYTLLTKFENPYSPETKLYVLYGIPIMDSLMHYHMETVCRLYVYTYIYI